MSGASGQALIVTGLSGAGKSTALRVFEDLGYFAVDGLPAGVAPEVAAIMLREPMRRFPGMAMGLDTRTENFQADFTESWQKLHGLGFKPRLIFLEADDRALMQRYAQTRRPHPLESGGRSLEAAIAAERRLLRPLRDQAELVIDSSQLSIHDLRRYIQRHVLAPKQRTMRVNLLSFGFKHGLPQDADFIFDLRFLANPYFVEHLRPLSGKDKEVADYVFADGQAVEFRDKLLDLLLYSLGRLEEEGRYRVTVALGCTGGRHRSVALVEDVAKALRQAEYPLVVEHRDLDRE